ncbi:Six-bladed beta-propeller TolB-like protein [Macrophomina phaseolina MS6]|uniref:Six-bladed beta-propeller TolB-like protein n=1 Tax=Macrophomina phaseolina (strain MS6) TaxID=1126212 RepID=K2RSM0_MACPH|nr:Six-bladed beta-propeller TolB-like protein [Macrophomina phaseolina MS6]
MGLLPFLATLAVGRAFAAPGFLMALPEEFHGSKSSWAWLSYNNPDFAVLPGHFNRTIFDSPTATNVTDPGLAAANQFLNSTNFVAYDEAFFDIIGPNATITHVQSLPYQIHEAPCFVPGTNKLFFVEWGLPGGDNGQHSWQYLLNTETNELRNITTDPPTVNVHGCVAYNGSLYVVTDGSRTETGYFAKIDPATWKRTTLLNHYYEQPFLGFNDIAVDPSGNFYLTDSKSAWVGEHTEIIIFPCFHFCSRPEKTQADLSADSAPQGRSLIPWTPPTNPGTYFVDARTLRPTLLQLTTGNANGVAVSPAGTTLYLADTGAAGFPGQPRSGLGARELWAYDVPRTASNKTIPVLTNRRLLGSPISDGPLPDAPNQNGRQMTSAGSSYKLYPHWLAESSESALLQPRKRPTVNHSPVG